MCIAIAKPANFSIPESHLRESFKSNPHGAGFCFPSDDVVEIQKGFFDFDSFYKAYRAYEKLPMLVHFRWATHGAQNEKNCHPWDVEQNAIVHNGVLGGYSSFHNGLSDTGNFVNNILIPAVQEFGDNILHSPFFIALMTKAMGDGNKMAAISPNGEISIYGEHLGEWMGGVWYSNQDYLPTLTKK